MKKQKIIIGLICLLVLGFVAFWACNKDDDITPVTVEKVSYDTDSIDGLKAFIQNHFEEKYALMISNDNSKSALVKKDIYSEYSNKEVADKYFKDIDNFKTFRESFGEDYFLGSKVDIQISKNAFKIDGNDIYFRVYVNYLLYTNFYDEETGRQANEGGVDLYEFVIKKMNNTFQIFKEDRINYGSQSDEYSTVSDTEETENLENRKSLKSTNSYSYKSSKAVDFAITYYKNAPKKVKGYVDYTYIGDSNNMGDCTNFLSWCLLKGGWTQNDNWFFTSDGTSGNNMKKYKRSPSWTGANYFYQYITSTGSMYSNAGGKNRVTAKFTGLVVPKNNKLYILQLNAFYTKIKTLKLGDIVELGNGGNPATITHNMIVTIASPVYPYISVTYRNADTLSPRLDRPLIELTGTKLYAFNVKANAN